MVNPKIQAQGEFIFIRGGISQKGSPYIQVSNGRKEMFLNISPLFPVTEHTFASYNDGDVINLQVEVTVGSDRVTLLNVL